MWTSLGEKLISTWDSVFWKDYVHDSIFCCSFWSPLRLCPLLIILLIVIYLCLSFVLYQVWARTCTASTTDLLILFFLAELSPFINICRYNFHVGICTTCTDHEYMRDLVLSHIPHLSWPVTIVLYVCTQYTNTQIAVHHKCIISSYAQA